jgi:anti-anti-sigma factor
MQMMRLDLEKQPGSTAGLLILRLDGKLSLETVSQFLMTTRTEAAPALILDMSGVSFLDSAGVGALVQLHVHRKNANQKFAIAALTQQGNAVMQVSGLTKLLPIFATVDEAKNHLA